MKVHVALNTPRFDESVRFYRTFLGLEPVKLKPGYAKFDVAEPALNLTLNASPDVGGGALNHLGIQVASTAAVKEAAVRLQGEGLATFEEADVDCCYALQREGLVAVTREGTYLRYRAEAAGLRDLLAFLYAECCTRSNLVPVSALKGVTV